MANRHAQGYTNRWLRASEAFREANPLCREGLEVLDGINGEPRPTQCTDHIIPHNGDYQRMWDANNWQPLCYLCHNAKTLRERMGCIVDWKPTPGRYVITGKPASGKTTWVERYGIGKVFDMDVEAERMGMTRDRRTKRQVQYFKEMRHQLIQDVLQSGADCTIIVTAIPVAFRIAKTLGARLVHCVVDEQERLRRMAMR